jgi:hypothetical protein
MVFRCAVINNQAKTARRVVSPASGFWSAFENLPRSLPRDQGYARQQRRGHAGIPVALFAPLA